MVSDDVLALAQKLQDAKDLLEAEAKAVSAILDGLLPMVKLSNEMLATKTTEERKVIEKRTGVRAGLLIGSLMSHFIVDAPCAVSDIVFQTMTTLVATSFEDRKKNKQDARLEELMKKLFKDNPFIPKA